LKPIFAINLGTAGERAGERDRGEGREGHRGVSGRERREKEREGKTEGRERERGTEGRERERGIAAGRG